jgi:hypothetical protein
LALHSRFVLALALLAVSVESAHSQESKDPLQKKILGRWDLVIGSNGQTHPAWLEVRLSGYRTLVGSYVGQMGSVRPISKLELRDGKLHFAIPPQWEPRRDDQVFAIFLDGETLKGETTDDKGRPLEIIGHRAPSLKRAGSITWDAPIVLFNGKDLTGWEPRNQRVANGWKVENGLLSNKTPKTDLLTEQLFNDFQLKVEFNCPRRSNSGIYLRGRYEMQIEDNFGDEPDSHKIGGIYGFLTPRINAGRKPGEWQTVEITLVGRAVTIVLNGERVIDRQEIPGITGGALDCEEGKPGPIMLQGDHGPIEFRNITIRRPARGNPTRPARE